MKITRNKLMYLCFISFAMIGFVFSMRTNIFSSIQHDYLGGYGHIATLILISGIIMQISTLGTGYVVKKWSHKFILSIGLALYSISALAMIFVHSILGFDILFCFYMFAYGSCTLAGNLYIGVLKPEERGKTLMKLHLGFSLGALAGPKIISGLLDKGINWQLIFGLSSIPTLIISFILIFVKEAEVKKNSQVEEKVDIVQETTYSWRNLIVWLFVLLFVGGQVWEYGLGTWFIIFARQTQQISEGQAASYLTVFLISYPIVRSIFSQILDKVGYERCLLFSFIGNVIFIGLGLYTSQLIFFGLTGIFTATMYPTIMAMMQQRFTGVNVGLIGWISMMGGMIEYVLIWAIGKLGDIFGITVGFGSLIIYMVMGAVIVLIIQCIYEKEKICYSQIEMKN
ncbi:MFS transporter [Clostridium ganghwense]|uniref:MFS transporter n=1 Tax=Clostridium ganghwense TaxID=312089 RepID=A0ABT4CJU3_9CLOT|nr:MFS transporter [Clostridium ganghwense]MCY6369319.1 MFS transporter [Clostridium ganghwense]